MGNTNIIFDKRKLAAYQIATEYCSKKNLPPEFLQELWDGILIDTALYEEFIYFLEKDELSGHASCEGFTMFDLYFHHLREYNMQHDIGKNGTQCDKDLICFYAFHTMSMLHKEPEAYKKMLRRSLGMDI